jgi:hypothetical protein
VASVYGLTIKKYKLLQQHQSNVGLICWIYQGEMRQIAFSLGGFFGQNVTLEGMLPLHFTCTGKGKPLFGTGVRLHFRHKAYQLDPKGWLLFLFWTNHHGHSFAF